jgi:hypothetical protein
MSIKQIIAELGIEIARLEQAKNVLAGATVKRGPGRPKLSTDTGIKKKRKMSAEGRAGIVAAVKARWAKAKKASK